MAVFRYQIVSVGMWRGKIKRWNTTVHTTDSNGISYLHDIMQACGYPNPGDVVGACSGGLASISCYASTGGAPVKRTVYFDWQTPSTWIPYLGTVWSDTPVGTPLDASGESAVTVEGLMGYLSSTGKPVKTRKFLHAIPSRVAAAYGDPDVSAAASAAIQTQWTGWMANPAGIQPTAVSVDAYYGNHQRVRGRRRTVTQVAAQSFSAGVVTGAAASTGGASPAQFQ